MKSDIFPTPKKEQFDRIIESSDELEEYIFEDDLVQGCIYMPENLSIDENIKNKKFEFVGFSKTEISEMTFRNCQFVNCYFVGTVLRECEFHRCEFKNCNPYKIKITDTYINPESLTGMLDPTKHQNVGVHLFQQLYKNSNGTYQSEFVSEAEFNWRWWKRQQLYYDLIEGNLPSKEWIGYFKNLLWQYTAGYGAKIRYIVTSSLFSIGFFVLINYLFWPFYEIVKNDGKVIDSASIYEAFYFTLVTIVTLGYGDYVPTSQVGMVVISIETLLGILLISVFASSLFKSFVR